MKNNEQKNHKFNMVMLKRLTIIHEQIKSGKYPNSNKLQYEIFEETGSKPSISTIGRDIDALRDYFRAPIEWDYKKKGFYYTEEFNLELNNISQDDIFYLMAAKTLCENFKSTPMYNDIVNTIDLIIGSTAPGQNCMIDRIAIPPTPKANIDKKIWEGVINGLQNNTILEFDYAGRWDSATKHRRVHPYQLLVQDGLFLLHCFDETADNGKGGTRLFYIPRIRNLTKTQDNFTLPTDYQFVNQCKGQYFGIFASDRVNTYTIEFYNESRQFVRDRVWTDDQVITEDDENNTTTITFTTGQDVKVMEWVLSQGANARPIAPKEFVKQWESHVRKMYNRINNDK